MAAATGHCLFTGLYVLLGQRCPLPAALYRQRATVIEEEVPFQSKIDLAVQQIEAFTPPQATHTHEFVDSWYHCTQVRKAAFREGKGQQGRALYLRVRHCRGSVRFVVQTIV